MIVDNHTDMRKVLASIVTSSFSTSLEVFECASGEDALIGYKLHQPDVVIMDIELKSMSGFDTTTQIRNLDSEAKIIFVSSYDSQKFRKHAEKLNAIGFVSKDKLSDIQPILKKYNRYLEY